MDEKDWELITVLYETKNVTNAAKKMHLTQPALSFRIKHIERYFEANMFVRGRKGVQFTQEGEFIAQKAREHIKGIARMRDTLVDMRETPSGVIRIGATNFVTKYILPYIMKEFRLLYPDVEFRVKTGGSRDIFDLVSEDEVHVGFVRGRYAWGGEKHLLYTETMWVVNNEAFALEDLPSMPMIHYQIDPTNQDLLDRWWKERFSVPPIEGMVVDRADTCHELIAQGFGYGFLPSTILKGELELHRREMTYASSGLPVERSVWMILHSRTNGLKPVRAFTDMVRSLDFSVV